MAEELPVGGTLESPDIVPPAEEPDETLPDGIDVKDGRVPTSVIGQVRREAREKAERRIREQEVAPLKRQGDELAELRRQNQELYALVQSAMQPPATEPTPMESRISDEEALAEARDLDLYDPQTHQPDVARAKRILARRRQEVEEVAAQVAQRTLTPVTQQTAAASSRQNFAQMALLRRPEDNAPWVDPKVLAEVWAQLPPELTAVPEVAQLVLDSVIGKAARASGRGRVAPPEREPMLSEAAGGRGQAFAMHDVERKVARAAGLSDKQYEQSAKGFQPGGPNVIGE